MRKPIICLDYDGTISDYSHGWQGIDVCNDSPVEGLWQFLEEAYEYFEIHIFSSRSESQIGIEAMMVWFVTHSEMHASVQRVGDVLWFWRGDNCILQLFFPTNKPPAHLTIDDRCLTFNGVWPNIQSLIDFKPWHKVENIFPKE